MLKKFFLVFLLLLLMLQSCSLINRFYGFTPEFEGKLEYVYAENERGELIEDGAIYMDTLYYKHHDSLIQLDEENATILLAWNLAWPYTWAYYSYQEETPLYIISSMSHELYFRHDYDFFSDTYIIEGTDVEILLCDAISEDDPKLSDIAHLGANFSLTFSDKYILRSQTNSALYLYLYLLYYENKWYAMNYYRYFALSEEFVEILAENNLLPTDLIIGEDLSEKTTEEETN